jgi:hypothetical protein
MGKPPETARKRLRHLRRQRQSLSSQLAKIDREITRITPNGRDKKPQNLAALNRWLDELSAGFPHVPALPADFSRADLYDDHD